MGTTEKKKILNCFIDSNIIIDYLFFRKSIKKFKDKQAEERFLALRKEDNVRAYNSYLFMKHLGEIGTNKYKFYISNYVLAEVLLSLINSYAVDIMKEKYIHVSYWNKEKNSVIKSIPEEEYIEAVRDFETFKEVFINSGIIETHNNLDLNKIPLFIFYGCHIQDAFLFCQAENIDCDYFLTKDKDLIDTLKKRSSQDIGVIPMLISNFKF